MKEDHTPWIEVTGGYAKDMTLRDYFAAKAMHHWLSLPIDAHQRQKLGVEAYKAADAMMERRNATQ